MPLYKTIHISPEVVLHVWKITESEDELRQGITLAPERQQRVSGMKSELHRRGFLSIRHLLALEGYQDRDLDYDDFGKPHLSDGNYISITHSFQFTGIIVGKGQKVGIDIEKQREKIIRIAYKFTTLDIYDKSGTTEKLVQKLTLIWGAKESIFKISAIQGLSFLQHIYVEPDFATKPWFEGLVNHNHSEYRYQVSHVEFEGFTCVFALKE